MKKLLYRVSSRIIEKPWEFTKACFVVYSILWTIIESISSIMAQSFKGLYTFLIIVIISLVFGAIFNRKRLNIKIKFPANMRITVKFGDLFKEDGQKVIAVNEFIDSEIGQLVSPKSLHGQMITRVLGNRSDVFDSLIEPQLVNKLYEFVDRREGKKKKYNIGECFTITYNNTLFYFPVFTHTDIENNKAYADIHDLLIMLEGLWEKIRIASNGFTVSMPLIGSGFAGLGIEPEKLLEILLISLFRFVQKSPINSEITFVLPEGLIEEVDLLTVKKGWG